MIRAPMTTKPPKPGVTAAILESGTWAQVPGFDGRYSVCTDGRLFRHAFWTCNGAQYKDRLLRPHLTNAGYPAYAITWNRKGYRMLMHRLIAQAFIPNPDDKPEVNHIDGNKTNNSLNNLEWATHKENMVHAYVTGLSTAPISGKGEAAPTAKLNKADVHSIRRLLQKGVPKSQIALRHNISESAIRCIANGTTWSSVT